MFDVATFPHRIALAYNALAAIAGERTQRSRKTGGWTREEILGHLIDSALNNHQRFVRAALDGHYEGPTYEQNGWVGIHGYLETDWKALLEHWRIQNELLSAVVARIPEERLGASCRIGENQPVTLEFVIEDYLHHLEHHVGQIASAEAAVNS